MCWKILVFKQLSRLKLRRSELKETTRNKNIVGILRLDFSCSHFLKRYLLQWSSDQYKNNNNNKSYILKTGFAGSQKPQKNLNFLQKDCLRTRKLSIFQCVLEIKVKRKDCCHSTLRYTHYPITALVVINTLLELFWHLVFKWSIFLKFYWFTHFSRKILLSQFTHFFRRFFEAEKQNPQSFALLECMHFHTI